MKTATANTDSRFTLDEAALRAAFENRTWILPFAPLIPDADELHHLLAQCEANGIIHPPNDRAGLAVYPEAIGEPAAHLAVDPGLGGPVLLGTLVDFRRGLVSDAVEGSLAVIADLVDQANRVLAEAARSYRGLLAL